MPGKWRQLRRLTAWQGYVLLASPFVLLQTWLRLRSRGYRNTLAWARQGVEPVSGADPDSNPAAPPAVPPPLELARDTAYALAVSIKYGPWRPRCLVRSVALGRFLGRKGIPFDLKIGVPAGQSVVGPDGTLDFQAHAWVELDGVVLNDQAAVGKDFRAFETKGRE